MRKLDKQNGSIIVSILIITVLLSTFVFSLIVLAHQNLARSKQRLLLLQSQYAAESGADSAIAILNSGVAYTGTGATDTTLLTNSLYKATYSVSVAAGSSDKEKIVTAVGKLYSPASKATPTYTRTIEVVVVRSSTSNTSSVLSRNIFEVASGVKNVWASNVFVNGYISLDKNTTNLIAENITVADKKTGATNCSLNGPGNLIKPATFSDPSQTKTKITVAYNNCISPPGNSSNSSFDVLANQTNISKIQSTYIPWSQYMDSSYQNSPGGCSDWTTGLSPRNIPSTGNTKKTHYPDSSGGISSTCGTSGDLSLGSYQYNIKDHVHIRANLCATTACSPTFYNPDSGAAGLKFVFIEGSVNFDAIQTAAGSGPIVFIAYGPDPASKAGVCPLGGAFYLGKNGISIAPQAYFIAMNGLCLDQTKFGVAKSIAGVSGKNIYIATNPGSPFDLALDLGFPYSSIPTDLSWKAARYRRL